MDQVRPGYDPGFLDAAPGVPLPAVTGVAAVLKYLHFTVVMHPGRRLAHYVAYNVAGKRLRPVPRSARRWSVDPLIADSLQMNVELTKHSAFHRGHLVSPVTVCWGDDDEADVSARQACFFPNITPQTSHVNTGSWLRLEEWERETARQAGRAVGFSGPVFSRDDEPFRGEMRFENGLRARDTFRVPRQFWKVVVVPGTDGNLACAAFLVMNAEKRESGSEGAAQVPLAELERLAGLEFAPALHDATRLRGPSRGQPRR
jgi:endonuclease G